MWVQMAQLVSLTTGKRFPIPPAAMNGQTRDITEFKILNQIGEGTYGVVYRATDIKTGQMVALKRVRMERESSGLPVSALREICLLRTLDNHNIVRVLDMASGSTLKSVYVVMEYCSHDLGTLLSHMKIPFSESEVKCLLIQLLDGVRYLHKRFVIHRDLKVSNLLLTDKGALKIADFGLARHYEDPPGLMTPLVVSLWYRAPELLLGQTTYSTAIDIWAVGCILGELWLHRALLQGKNELHQIELITNLLGTPTTDIWPGIDLLPNFKNVKWASQPFNTIRDVLPTHSHKAIDMFKGFLTYDPNGRLSARDALTHPYLREAPLPTSPEMLPTFPEHRNLLHNEQSIQKRKRQSDDDPFNRY
eukprot:CFRG8204T1